MKISVLIPSDEYKSYAGARIRYGRLASELHLLGIELSLEDIGTFDPATSSADAVLISKCHDARSLVAAAAARTRGQRVGVDLFDDYFSQGSDSRLVRFRTWLSQLVGLCDFALCSTPAMAAVVRGYREDLPVHVVNDPAPVADISALPDALGSKLTAASDGQTLRIAWFGVGDSPHFQVGLADLAAFGDELDRLTKSGADLELSILTNERALTADGLALIDDLPIRTKVSTWTEEGERHLLSNSFACFLPVNAQAFSAAKSLNRAVTALAAGCQVISNGFPLYEPLGNLIYGDLDEFMRDLSAGKMKHSAGNIGAYRAAFEGLASPANEAARIAEFIRQIPAPGRGEDETIVLVQGQSPNGLAHKAVKALKGLSVASPFCPPALGFDIVFRGGLKEVAMLVSDSASHRLKPDIQRDLKVSTTVSDRKFWLVPSEAANSDSSSLGTEWHSAPLPFQIAAYPRSMKQIRERMDEAFGPCRFLLSENSQLPFTPEL